MAALMPAAPRLFIVVPAFNEAPNLPQLFSGFREIELQLKDKFNLGFIIVDDGSNDGTPEIARQLASGLTLEVLSHGSNLGPGTAFATAFNHLSKVMDADDWVITMEGDNTSRHGLIRQMLRRAEEGFDAIFASPYMYGGGLTQTTLLRRFLSSAANLVVKDMLNVQGILTVSSFFRLYRASPLRRLQAIFGPGIVERRGFESMVEMTMKMTMLNLTISEVAMQLDSSLRKGKSKMKILRTILGYFALWSCKDRWLKAVRTAQAKTAASSRPHPRQAQEH
ncbi:MAG: glycosyltransferase family 2 protein [Betaproteobacteria bacterium]|nr:glycosyltransferase family 2 protein [Betaproteobacteria bacterium]